jgi:hypothetical protein
MRFEIEVRHQQMTYDQRTPPTDTADLRSQLALFRALGQHRFHSIAGRRVSADVTPQSRKVSFGQQPLLMREMILQQVAEGMATTIGRREIAGAEIRLRLVQRRHNSLVLPIDFDIAGRE